MVVKEVQYLLSVLYRVHRMYNQRPVVRVKCFD